MISLEATEKYMELGIQWLLPRHYEEVIDERVSDGKCGYPLCHQGLQQTSKSIRKIYSSNSINQEILQNYCSINCCEKGQRYLESLDESSPYTRKAVKSLASSIKRQGT